MLDIAKIQTKIKQRHEEHDRIWNAAIEAAANVANALALTEHKDIEDKIRKLKKCGHND